MLLKSGIKEISRCARARARDKSMENAASSRGRSSEEFGRKPGLSYDDGRERELVSVRPAPLPV